MFRTRSGGGVQTEENGERKKMGQKTHG
jgi:hypothetical protein